MQTDIRLPLAALAAAAFTIAGPAESAAAQGHARDPVHVDPRHQQVVAQLDLAGEITRDLDYVQTHGPWTESLRQGTRRRWTVRLTGGVSYRMLGVCDHDCRNLDLRLYAGGDLVAQDVQPDDVPVVSFTPPVTRDYTVEVIMRSCRLNPCRFGVAGYARSAR